MNVTLSRLCPAVNEVALMRHCHHVINALGPATPPEVFLYRGNAYFLSGKPYFALADYNLAARALKLSGEHQAKCLRVLPYFPDEQVGIFPSSDAHLHMFVKPFFERCDVQSINEVVGRGVVSTDSLTRGAVVLRASEPWMRYAIGDGLCSFCAEPLPERAIPCENCNCHEEYCSRDCRTRALMLYHAPVCTNTQFQSLELDLYAQQRQAEKAGSVSDRNAASAQLLTLRIMAAAVHGSVVPTAIPQVRLLSGRLSYSPEVLCGAMLHMYERLAQSLRVSTVVSYEEVISVLARVTANVFHVGDHAVELNLPRSLFNHSCEANVCERADTGELVVSVRDVYPGEELTINYYPQLQHLSYAERSAELGRRGFLCECVRCQREKKAKQSKV